MSVEFLIGTAGALLLQLAGAVWWVSALQSRVTVAEDRANDLEEDHKTMLAAMEKQRDRSDQVYNEVRAVTLSIQKSLSRLEGRLSISPKDD